MHNLVNRTAKNILEAKYIKIHFDRNSVCMGDDCNPHDEYIIIANNTSMLDIINRLKSLVPWTANTKQSVFSLNFIFDEQNTYYKYVLGAYYETDNYSYCYAVEPQKTIKMILENFYNVELHEWIVHNYSNSDEYFCDTSKPDGIPCFMEIYASVGSDGDTVPFEKLNAYLSELVNKQQKLI